MATDSEKQRAEELGNSRDLDVHKWSDYPEVNRAIDQLYKEFQELPGFAGKKYIQKTHIKVIVLDLYVRYLEDQLGYIAFYRMKGKYEGKSRYNQLHISFKSVAVIDNLEKLGYLEQTKGHYDRSGARQSHKARMRATVKLIDLIRDKHHISPEMIEKDPHTECIILKDEDKNIVDYIDTEDTNRQRDDLYAYNNLLRRTHMDVHSYPEEGAYSESKERRIKLDRTNKFIRRIYNNSSWADGGRYYGGFWQVIPKRWREYIRINGSPVVEIDYSGLHIILLYGHEGIDYWKDVGKDPYGLEEYKHLDKMRDLLKVVLLTVLNSDSREAAVKAIRKKIYNINKKTQKRKYQWFIDEAIDIGELIDKFTDIHKPIQKYFFGGMGVKLQGIDSKIAERVINQLTKEDIPVLCVHDSFIVAKEHKDKLHQLMIDAFKGEFPEILPRMKDTDSIFSDGIRWVPLRGCLNLQIEEDPESQENRDMELRLREHQKRDWSREYYKKDPKKAKG